MNVPNYATLARTVFQSFPADIAQLRAWCDETDNIRNQNPNDPRVAAGETKVNNLKGLFTRRIAWALWQADPRFGLRAKTIGQIATRPVDGKTHSTDAVMWEPTGNIVDVMSDRDVSWGQDDNDMQPRDQWMRPLVEEGPVQPATQPGTPTDEPADPPTPGGFIARVDALEAQLGTLAKHFAGLVDTVNAQGRALTSYQNRLNQIEARPAPLPDVSRLVIELPVTIKKA